MALQNAQPEDIRATLAVSQEEAQTGGSRAINLAGGRTVTVTVPAGIRDGEELRLPGQGNASTTGGAPGDPILRVMVVMVDRARDEADEAPTARLVHPLPMAPARAEYAAGATSYTAPADRLPPASYSPASERTVGDYAPPDYRQSPGGPRAYPGAGAYPNYQVPDQVAHAGQVFPPQYYSPQQPPQARRGRAGAVTAVILVLLLLIGSGLGLYFGYYQPRQTHTGGTVTAQTQIAGTAQVSQTGTAQAYQGLYTQVTGGTPALNDPLNAQTNSQWDDSTGTNGSCGFTGDSYASSVPDVNFFQPCYAENTNFSNFAFQIDMTIKQGDEGGIIFRADSTNDMFYLFNRRG